MLARVRSVYGRFLESLVIVLMVALAVEVTVGVVFRYVRQRHKRCHRLAAALDDQALPGGGLIQECAELLPDVERGHGSHSTIIAL